MWIFTARSHPGRVGTPCFTSFTKKTTNKHKTEMDIMKRSHCSCCCSLTLRINVKTIKRRNIHINDNLMPQSFCLLLCAGRPWENQDNTNLKHNRLKKRSSEKSAREQCYLCLCCIEEICFIGNQWVSVQCWKLLLRWMKNCDTQSLYSAICVWVKWVNFTSTVQTIPKLPCWCAKHGIKTLTWDPKDMHNLYLVFSKTTSQS